MKKIILLACLLFPLMAMAQQDMASKSKWSVRPKPGGVEPLYVLDGKILSADKLVKDSTKTIMSIKYIDPNDIESITVLQDSAATKKYGDAGKNGVVIFVTKVYSQKSKKQ